MTSTTTRRGTRSTEHVRRFGELFRKLREYYNLSMNELARQTGIPLHTITDSNKGRSRSQHWRTLRNSQSSSTSTST